MQRFNGKTPQELRKFLKIPKKFRVDEIYGVPLDQISRRFLVIFLEGAIVEARTWRKKVMDAMDLGEKILDKDGRIKGADEMAATMQAAVENPGGEEEIKAATVSDVEEKPE